MTAALQPVINRLGPRTVVLVPQLSWPEATAFCYQAFLIETLGLRAASTVAASLSGDAATVLCTAMYKLYLGVREAMEWDLL